MRHFDEPFRNAPLTIKPANYCTPHTMYPAAALLSACSQASTHPTFPLFPKCQDTETGLSVAGWVSQLAKVMLAMQTVSHQATAGSVSAVHMRPCTGFKKCPWLRNRSKSDPCSYQLFYLDSLIPSFPKVVRIPPETSCVYIYIYIMCIYIQYTYIFVQYIYLWCNKYVRYNIHFYIVLSDRTLVVLLHKQFLFTPSPFFNSASIITICICAAINKPNVTIYEGYPENKFC